MCCVLIVCAGGLSGFLEYKKLDGSWRPFLFQTVDYQLMVYRVHVSDFGSVELIESLLGIY